MEDRGKYSTAERRSEDLRQLEDRVEALEDALAAIGTLLELAGGLAEPVISRLRDVGQRGAERAPRS